MSTIVEPVSTRWPVRLWPGFLILAVIALSWSIPSWVAPRSMFAMFSWLLALLVGAVASLGWWAFGARVRGVLRWFVPVLVFVPLVVLPVVVHTSSERLFVIVYGLLAALVVWIGWLIVSVPFSAKVRQLGLLVSLSGLWLVVGLLRVDGADANAVPHIRWRWHLSDEEQFLAEKTVNTTPTTDAKLVECGPGDWPEFRGPKRDGITTGVKLNSDWASHPPERVWKKRVGPGWGSFAVAGGKLYTQEQRGPEEAVVCYDAATGAEIWEFKVSDRFEESISGAGPRATPTVHGGKLYVQGATGKVHRLDAATGKREWTADVIAVGGTLPQWGFSASPLVIDGLVIVYAGGGKGKGTAAFNADTGDLVWIAGDAKHAYSSVHSAQLNGIPQVLMLSDYGLESFRPADGTKLWEYAWLNGSGSRVTQPAILSDTDVLIGTGVGDDQGVRRLRVTKTGETWDVKMVWSSRGAKPYFNDGVVVGGQLYGFDGNRFCCVDLSDGRQTWKETAYGHGQVIGLADQGLLLVLAENGAVAVVEANPSELSELGKVPVLTGKTWNHPVVAHGFLYVRNSQEAACYRLPTQ